MGTSPIPRVAVSALLFLFTFANVSDAVADEAVYSKERIHSLGYRSVPKFSKLRSKIREIGPQSLPWPVSFENTQHNMGNSMMQFQKYGFSTPYFHGGCDLRAAAGSDVRTPVGGRLEAGHYAYETGIDGSLEKSFAAWPATGERMYFEVAIVTDDGVRYEFHHVDRSTLPASIKQRLDRGGSPRVEAGEILGRVITWPVRAGDGSFYHHIHYNIVLPDSSRLNPQYASYAIEDRDAPQLHGVYAIGREGRVIELHDHQTAPTSFAQAVEIVVAVTDKNEPNVYTHPPARLELTTADGKKSGWDFRQHLLAADGKFPNIISVFQDSLRLPDGRTLRTQGDYDNNFFLMRLPLPANATLPIQIQAEDAAGTSTLFTIQ